MWLRWNMEKVPRFHLNNPSVRKRGSSATRNNHSNMFHSAKGLTDPRSHIVGPFPTRVVRGSPDRHATERYSFKFSLGEAHNLVGLFELLEYDFDHVLVSLKEITPGAAHYRSPPTAED